LNNRKSPLTDAIVGLYSLWGYGRELKPEPILFDAVTVSMILWPELFTTRKDFVKVTDEDTLLLMKAKNQIVR